MKPNTQHNNPKVIQFNIVGQTAFANSHYEPLKPTGKGVIPNFGATQRFETLKNYQMFVHEYNASIKAENLKVIDYNAKLFAFIKQNKLEDLHKTTKRSFAKEMYMTSIEEYNAAARIKNQIAGKLLIPLKKHTRISPAYKTVFEQLLLEYSSQIKTLNEVYKQIGNRPRGLLRVKANLYKIANNTSPEGYKYCDYNERTVQNHLKRFVEAGILFGYEFGGYYYNKATKERCGKPSKYFIKGEILSIFDCKTKKTLNTDNQLYTYRERKDLTNNKTLTRTYINKKEIIEPVNKQSRTKGTETPSSLLSKMQLSQKSDNNKNINENTNTRKDKKPTVERQTSGADFSPKISSYLYDNIEDVQCLIQDLTQGHYKNYRFLHRHQLEKEVFQGNLPKSEFRELLLQVFIKLAGPIYKNSTPNEGSWRTAWNIINDEFLLNPNGSTPSKPVLMYKFDNLVYRITYAKRFFNKFKEFNPLYPSQYFDPTRKQKKSGGFAYTLEALKKHQKSIENKEKQKNKQLVEAQKRNYKLKAIELVEKQVNKLKNGKITIPQLHDYVSNNAYIPKEIKHNLPKYIQRIYSC